MKCTTCEKEILGGLDTFGSIKEPLCFDCFITDAIHPKIPNQKALDDLEDLEDKLSEIRSSIDDLEDEAWEIEQEIRILKQGDKKKESLINEKEKLKGWISGTPKIAPNISEPIFAYENI